MGEQTNGQLRERTYVVACEECRRLSDDRWLGWRACRADDPDGDEPLLAFYCPACAAAEFGVDR
jgi:hypothetical protein